jgi:hypothetical protein
MTCFIILINFFRLVGPPLQPMEAGLFPGMGCEVPSRVPLQGADRIQEFWAVTSGPLYLG